MINRRSFLKLLGKAGATIAAAPLAYVAGDTLLSKPRYEHIAYSKGFTVNKGVIINSSFSKALWPGIEQFYNKAYASHKIDFRDLFNE